MKTRHISRRFRRFLEASEAVSALEYAILVGVVTVAVGGAIVTFSGQIGTAISNIGNDLGAVTAPTIDGDTIDPTPSP